MSRASKQITLLLSRAAQALEKGEMYVKVPTPDALATGQAGATQAVSAAQDGGEAGDLHKLCRTFNRMAEAVRARDRECLHYVATAAHDLKTPLSIISDAARALQKHGDELSREERDERLDCIIRNATSLEMLACGLIDDVRQRTEYFELQREEVDLCALAREVVRDYGTTMRSHPLRFDGEGRCLVLGDRERLRRLLFNLLSNAVKYSETGREVCVAIWRRGASVCLEVQDDGTGIPPAKTERIFRGFKRLDATRDMAPGDGLGLASAKQIADAHGAQIKVQGAPGRGTTIEVCFKAKA